MYTDDTVMDVSHKDQETVKDLLDKDLESIAVCFESNKFIINLKKGKTESILFGTGK